MRPQLVGTVGPSEDRQTAITVEQQTGWKGGVSSGPEAADVLREDIQAVSER